MSVLRGTVSHFSLASSCVHYLLLCTLHKPSPSVLIQKVAATSPHFAIHVDSGTDQLETFPTPMLWHRLHAAMYLSAPPITSTSVSFVSRRENAASLWHIMQTALSLVMFSARGIRSNTAPNGCNES